MQKIKIKTFSQILFTSLIFIFLITPGFSQVDKCNLQINFYKQNKEISVTNPLSLEDSLQIEIINQGDDLLFYKVFFDSGTDSPLSTKIVYDDSFPDDFYGDFIMLETDSKETVSYKVKDIFSEGLNRIVIFSLTDQLRLNSFFIKELTLIEGLKRDSLKICSNELNLYSYPISVGETPADYKNKFSSRNNSDFESTFKNKDQLEQFRNCFYDLSMNNIVFEQYRGNVNDLLAEFLAKLYTEVYKEKLFELFSERSMVDSTQFLFYSFADNYLNLFLFDNKGLIAYDTTGINNEELYSYVNDFRFSIGVDSLQLSRTPYEKSDEKLRGTKVFRTTPGPNKLDEINKHLSKLLFPDLILDSLMKSKTLIIIPVDCIGSIPFYALQPYADGTYIVDHFNIVLASSFRDILRYSETAWDNTFENPLIVGNPEYPQNSDWIFPDLPGAKDEATKVARIFKTDPLIGKAAVKNIVIDKAKDADLLYFATHAMADYSNPFLGTFLVFAGDSSNDFLWTYDEIQNSNLSAKLCVLSACQTGEGKIMEGGIMTLAEAFQKAGVPRVVMSLWSINDKVTETLMVNFINYLANNPPYIALRLATLKVKKDYPEPKYWAPFLYFGFPY
jgi:hypothetical protein